MKVLKKDQRNVLKRKKPYEELKITDPLTIAGQKAKEKAPKVTSIKYLRYIYMKRSPMKGTLRKNEPYEMLNKK